MESSTDLEPTRTAAAAVAMLAAPTAGCSSPEAAAVITSKSSRSSSSSSSKRPLEDAVVDGVVVPTTGRRSAEEESKEPEEMTEDDDECDDSTTNNNNNNNNGTRRRRPAPPPQPQPRAFQGGWQGFTLDDREQEQQLPDHRGAATSPEKAEDAMIPSTTTPPAPPTSYPDIMDNVILPRCWERNYPRSYHVLLFIVLPLLGLIALCFLCGYWVALLEAPRERNDNDALLAAIVEKAARLKRLQSMAEQAPRLCLEQYPPFSIMNNDTTTDEAAAAALWINRTDLLDYMIDCGAQLALEIQDIVEEFTGEWRTTLYSELHFDWTQCRPNATAPRDRFHQAEYLARTWWERAMAALGLATNNNNSTTTTNAGNETTTTTTTTSDFPSSFSSFNESVAMRLNDVVASDTCQVNGAAGALFWFTVMATIGYGNATPSTSGGRILVYTIGFLSILIFTATIGQAGYVALVVADDFFHRIGWSRCTKGWTAVLLWLVVLVAWILVIAGWAMLWSRNRYAYILEELGQGGMPLADAVWFSYISVTTVGFGDIYIPPDTVEGTDLLYLPLLFLIGFVLLANFLLKLSDVIVEKYKGSRKPSLESLLERTRTSDNDNNNNNNKRSHPNERDNKPIAGEPVGTTNANQRQPSK